MAQGSNLSNFADFWLATSGQRVSEPGTLESQASQYRTHLFPLMLKGLSQKEMVQAGKKIEDYIQLKYTDTFSHVNPTDTFTYTGTDSLTQIEVPWRFSVVKQAMYEHEIDLQNGGRDVVYKKVAAAKDAELELSWHEGMERALWAEPNFDTMENSTLSGTGAPLSIPCFITMDGGAPTASNSILTAGTAGATASWTSVMTVSPTTFPNWKNQFASFTNTNAASRLAESGGVLSAMDQVYLKCQFRSPANGEQYVKNTTLQKYKICCNERSYNELVSIIRQKNNMLTPSHDAGWPQGMIGYKGIAVEYVAILDSLMYDSTAGAAADGSGADGYRWLFINFNKFRPIFHSKHFRRMQKKDGGASNPFAMAMIEDTWHNLWCSNRREQGVVFAA